MNTLIDECLMQRVKAGEIQCAGLLFERYQKPIYHYFLNRLGNQADAEDSTQMTFSRMLKYRHSYKAGKKFSSWLFTIAVNQRSSVLNERQRSPIFLEDVAEHQTENRKSHNSLEHNQLKANIFKCLAKMPDDANDVLSLYLWQERDYSELAEIFGSKVATVRVKVHRALKQLRQCLVKNGELTHD